MNLEALVPYLIPGAVAIIVAWIGLRPKRVDPDEFIQKELQRLAQRVSEQDTKIDTLNSKLETLWSQNVHAKRHIVRLENQLVDADQVPLDRPEQIRKLFDL